MYLLYVQHGYWLQICTLLSVPELHIAPSDTKISCAGIGGVSSDFVVERVARNCIIIAIHFLAINIDTESFGLNIVNSMDIDGGSNCRDTFCDGFASFDVV